MLLLVISALSVKHGGKCPAKRHPANPPKRPAHALSPRFASPISLQLLPATDDRLQPYGQATVCWRLDLKSPVITYISNDIAHVSPSIFIFDIVLTFRIQVSVMLLIYIGTIQETLCSFNPPASFIPAHEWKILTKKRGTIMG
jgi:hypothetical protein